MFEDIKKEIRRMHQQTLSFQIGEDEKGYIDKQCPSEECEFLFKVNKEDWKDIFRDEAVWCPCVGMRLQQTSGSLLNKLSMLKKKH